MRQVFGYKSGGEPPAALIHLLHCKPTTVVMAKGRLLFLAAMAILTQGRSSIQCDAYHRRGFFYSAYDCCS